MKGYIIFALFLIAVTGYNLEKEWRSFKKKYRKSYSDKSLEGKLRKKNFEDNLKFIEEHNKKYKIGKNKKNPSIRYKLEVTQFADMTYKDFSKTYTSNRKLHRAACKKSRGKRLAPNTGRHRLNGTQPPDEVNWDDIIGMTAIQTQGDCGCCWAYASIGVIESHRTIHRNITFKKLSEQELVDCVNTSTTSGCDGGIHYESFDYIFEEGVTPALHYPTIMPIEARDCKTNQMRNKVSIAGYRFADIVNPNEDELQDIVAFTGPVAASIATPRTMMLYGKNSGVFNDPECNELEAHHYVIIVGYGTDEVGDSYWLIKNSWSSDWGEDGYMKLARNASNMCHIASEAFYPII